MRLVRRSFAVAGKWVPLVALASLVVPLTGCGASAEAPAVKSPTAYPQQAYGYPQATPVPAVPLAPPLPPTEEADRSGDAPSVTKKSEAPSRDGSAEPPKDRARVVYTARVTMVVYQVETGLAAVEKIAREHGGFLAKKGDREITIRVPRARFEAALAGVDTIGDVVHRDIHAEDVTEEHVDLEVRIKNARAMQRRLQELLLRAAVKEALEIEKELHRVTEELERLEGRLKVLQDRVALSTITVSFEPRGTTLQAKRVSLPFPWLGQLGLPSLLSLEDNK